MKRLLVILLAALPAIPAYAAVEIGTNAGFLLEAPTADPAASNGTIDGYASAMQFTAPADATRVVAIGWYCDTDSEEGNWEGGIYADSSGAPGSQVGVSATNAKGTTAGWKQTGALNIAITGGATYWIAIQLDNCFTATYANYSVITGNRESISGATALPSPWSGGTPGADRVYAYYAIYETGTASTIPVLMHHHKRSH